MACSTGFNEWTFDLVIEKTFRELHLVFCMKFEGEVVSGKVIDPDAPPPGELSDLTGTHVALGASGLFVLNLEFVWSDVRINLTGITFPRGKEQFRGGFVVSDRNDLVRTKEETSVGARSGGTSIEALPQVPQTPPESGETGTGNGQQT